MRLSASIREKNALQMPGVQLRDAEGRKIAEMAISGSDWIKLTEREVRAIAERVAELIETHGVEIEIREKGFRPERPSWMEGEPHRVPGVAKLPPQVQIGEDGEIVVPKKHANETPEEKRIRRAARKARNEARAAAGGQ